MCKGTGKTCAVFACAAELGFRVIEINSTFKRSGSKILELFGEATQSHHMEKWNLNASDEIKIASQDLNTILLFEEVDILFEDDTGFLKALKTLMNTTKRPIILTCNGISFTSIINLIQKLTNL